MKIAELSRVSGTHRSTIHHYLDLGLLPRPETLGPRLHHFGPGKSVNLSRRPGGRRLRSLAR
ncbi:MerR family DNA-binding transcriptional regulator [Nannocystis pusilla]|uniref:MerR family DNA-binding transcriptional regulator n=1 Tax=Nannocystis pusilla TaxID=889268 RepID=A0ABS7TR82_9BACT|nr:MerR family DNA-binding transcriptional regulator [Nannocystis pusilla]MBZ5710733.1 MerR family DNA-binding transcriptional regulator [Nannocystis pusilla]